MERQQVVYIMGPMSGIEDYNYPAFHAAEQALEACGYAVLNPARVTDELTTFRHENSVMSRLRYVWDLIGEPCPRDQGEIALWRWCMRRTRMQLACADIVAQLPMPTPDWVSKGVDAETADANLYGIPIKPLAELIP